MTHKIYESLLGKVNSWPQNGINGLLLEEEISSEYRAGQYSKEQEEYLLRTLRLRVNEEAICLECGLTTPECACPQGKKRWQ